MAYLLDANVLIEAKNRYYGFDFCPAFWDWIIQQHAAELVYSVERVGDELIGKGDDLDTWASDQGEAFFLAPDGVTTAALSRVSREVAAMRIDGQPYRQAAIAGFLASADYYLISHALAHGHTVVTHEVGNQASVKRVKIPDVCGHLNVPWVLPFKMLRDEGAQFVL